MQAPVRGSTRCRPSPADPRWRAGRPWPGSVARQTRVQRRCHHVRVRGMALAAPRSPWPPAPCAGCAPATCPGTRTPPPAGSGGTCPAPPGLCTSPAMAARARRTGAAATRADRAGFAGLRALVPWTGRPRPAVPGSLPGSPDPRGTEVSGVRPRPAGRRRPGCRGSGPVPRQHHIRGEPGQCPQRGQGGRLVVVEHPR